VLAHQKAKQLFQLPYISHGPLPYCQCRIVNLHTCRQCLPYLKSCMRGVGWQDSHWAQLFALLGFKPGVLSKETVTLSHFLNKCDAVVANAEAIKSLDATVRPHGSPWH
jgi:hypothetical protein